MEFKRFSFREMLSNIVDNRGKTCPTSEAGLPLIATNCIKNDTLFPVFEKIRHVSKDTYNTWFRGHPEPGDIIFVCKGSPGRVAWVDDPVPYCIAQDMVAIRANKGIVYPKYLFALLRSQVTQNQILNMHVGTLIPHFKKGDFSNLYLDIPTKTDYQEFVGDVYFSFCEKIELNRRMNETLEAMAQALFKSWFVDFDPVIDNALAAGNEIPEALKARAATRQALGDARKPLPEEIRQLFPSSFEYSEEMGWIPEWWIVSTIGEQVETNGGGTPSTKDASYWEGGVHAFCTPKDMSNLTSLVLTDTERHLTDKGVNKISSGQLPVDVLLMSSRAPIGYLAISDVPVSVNQGIIAMSPNEKYGALFLLCWTHFNMGKITDRANGSTFLEISKKNFRPIPFLIPNEELLKIFNAQAKSIYSKLLLCSKNMVELSKLRDTLLPKLLSGQIRIPDAEKLVEAMETFCLSSGIAVDEWVQEIAGGMNFKRKKFLKIMDDISEGTVEKLLIAHKDRLARFGFDFFAHTASENGCELVVVNQESLSPQQEMVEDLMSIIHTFSCRLYGLRKYKKKIREVVEGESH